MDEEIMNEEVMGEEEEVMEESGMQEQIMQAIQPCLDRIANGEYATKDEAIDAMIADLEAAREGGEVMGGLGIEDEPMDLGDAEDEL